MIINIVIVAAVVAAIAGILFGDNTRNANILRFVAQLITAATVAALFVPVANDSGTAVWFLLGVPLAAAALPLLGGNVFTWGAAVIIIGWGLLLGLGIGLYLLPAGFCMLVAAAAQLRACSRERQ